MCINITCKLVKIQATGTRSSQSVGFSRSCISVRWKVVLMLPDWGPALGATGGVFSESEGFPGAQR